MDRILSIFSMLLICNTYSLWKFWHFTRWVAWFPEKVFGWVDVHVQVMCILLRHKTHSQYFHSALDKLGALHQHHLVTTCFVFVWWSTDEYTQSYTWLYFWWQQLTKQPSGYFCHLKFVNTYYRYSSWFCKQQCR